MGGIEVGHPEVHKRDECETSGPVHDLASSRQRDEEWSKFAVESGFNPFVWLSERTID
jgi:hypothetical protein